MAGKYLVRHTKTASLTGVCKNLQRVSLDAYCGTELEPKLEPNSNRTPPELEPSPDRTPGRWPTSLDQTVDRTNQKLANPSQIRIAEFVGFTTEEQSSLDSLNFGAK